MAGQFHSRAGRVALGGILSAASLVFLYLASIAPTGRLGLTALAGLFPVGAVLAAGRSTGYLCWAATSALALIMVPDKGMALLYLIFLGLYPVVKSRIESLKNIPLEWVCKMSFFLVALTIAWFGVRTLFFPTIPTWIAERSWLVYPLGMVVFVVYDMGLSTLINRLLRRKNSR